MTDVTNNMPLVGEALRLCIEENAAKLLYSHVSHKGHTYVFGGTGTGKSIVARRLACILEGEYFNCELLSPSEWMAQYSEIEARLLNSVKTVLVLDGFFPHSAGPEFNTLLMRLTEKGVSLFVFSQEWPYRDYPSTNVQREFNCNLFSTIAEFRSSDCGGRYPVTFHQVK